MDDEQTDGEPAESVFARFRRRWGASVLVGVAGVVVIVLAAWVVLRITQPPRPPVAPYGPSASPAWVATATPTPTAAPGPSDHVIIPAIGVDALLRPYTAEEAAKGYDSVAQEPCLIQDVIVCVDPENTTDVVWQQGGSHGVGWGVAPSRDATQNVYLFGHADQAGDAVFSHLSNLAPGAAIEIGDLTYLVQQVVTVDKSDYTSLPQAVQQVPGRLLLISCNHGADATLVNGGYSTTNIVVIAQLAA